MKRLQNGFILFLIGGTIYILIELLWRGRSHISMFVLGGICFLFIGGINEVLTWETPLWKQCLIGMIIILLLEFLTGCIINLWLGLDIWDYSHLPLNLFGQICLPFALLWYLLSAVAIILDDWLRYWLFGEEKPHYKLI